MLKQFSCRKAIVIMSSIRVSNFYVCFTKNIARVSGGYVMFLRSPPSRTNNVRRLRRNVDVHHEVGRRQDREEEKNQTGLRRRGRMNLAAGH